MARHFPLISPTTGFLPVRTAETSFNTRSANCSIASRATTSLRNRSIGIAASRRANSAESLISCSTCFPDDGPEAVQYNGTVHKARPSLSLVINRLPTWVKQETRAQHRGLPAGAPTESAAVLSDGNRLTLTKNCLLLCVPWPYSSLQRRGAEVSVADRTPGNTLRSPPFFTNPLGPGGTLTSAALPASA
jgi:hypothetical protein